MSKKAVLTSSLTTTLSLTAYSSLARKANTIKHDIDEETYQGFFSRFQIALVLGIVALFGNVSSLPSFAYRELLKTFNWERALRTKRLGRRF